MGTITAYGEAVKSDSAPQQITQEIKTNPNLTDLQSPEQKQTVKNQDSTPTHVGQVSRETEEEPFILPFYKKNVKMLKILSV